MEIGILKFEGTHEAEDALKEVFDAEADRRPWLHEVGVVSRPLLGRLTIRASYPESREAYREGDIARRAGGYGAYTGYLLGALAGPLRQAFFSVAASEAAEERVSEVEKKLFHIDQLKELLPRGSSAVILIAEPPIVDEMVEAFASYAPTVIRRDVAEELRGRLRALREQSLQQLEEMAASEAPPPAMH
jgi:uncharacterized membrane protein